MQEGCGAAPGLTGGHGQCHVLGGTRRVGSCSHQELELRRAAGSTTAGLGLALSLEPAPEGSQLHTAPWHCSGPELCVPVALLGASSFRAWVRGVPWAPLALAAWGALALFWLLSDSSVCNKGCGERV